MTTTRRVFIGGASAATALTASGVTWAQKKYDDGASDTEIKLGNTNPYSGPASSYGTIGKALDGYWRMVNDQGGINGRKVKFISLDDGYSPPKTVEMVRQLVEQEKVLSLFQTLGTPCNSAIHRYVNQRKIPHLFIASGASKWGNPKEYPWSMGFQPDYVTESTIYAKHMMATIKDAKIAVLMQNDDYGKDYYEGFRHALGKEVSRIVKHVTYEVTDPTVDSQVIQLKDSGANVFFNISIPKFAAQAMRKAAEIGWRPHQYLNSVSGQVGLTMKPAGFQNVQNVITTQWLKDPTDKQWDNDAELKTWRAWMAKYNGALDPNEVNLVFAYAAAFLMHETLKKCGDTLTRDNLMKQAASHKNLRIPCLLPGIMANTSPTDFYPVQALRLARFKGEGWEQFGELISAESA